MSEDSSDTPDSGNPLPVSEFIHQNHRLFTVIGVFAGLSAYLLRLGSGSPGHDAGVAASLLLFLLVTTVGMYRSYQASETVRTHGSVKSVIWVIPYAVFQYSLFFLAVSIFQILQSQYPRRLGEILGSTIIYSAIFIYGTLITTSDVYSKISSRTKIGRFYSGSPYFAILPTFLWFYWRWSSGNIPSLMETSVGEAVGLTIGIIIMHLAFTVFCAALMALLDYVLYSDVVESDPP